MRNDSPTKDQKRHLRELAGLAYERDLNAALEKLHKLFEEWKAGKRTPFDLDDEIHKHHQGIARDLYSIYSSKNYTLNIYSALKRGVIKPDEIREDCRHFIPEL